MKRRPAPALAAISLILLLLPGTATAATPIIYDERPFLTQGSTVDLYEGAVLEIEEIVPGGGLKTELIYNGTTQSANVPLNDTYTYEIDGEPYVKLSEIEIRSTKDENYSYARIQQHRGYRVILSNCTAEQTDEELNVRFTLANRGFRWVDSRLTLVAGGRALEETFSLGKFSSANTRITMKWNRTEEGAIESYDLIAKVPDQKEGSGDICGGEVGETQGAPVATATETPATTETPTETLPTKTAATPSDTESGATETETEIETTTATEGETEPAPTETPAPTAPVFVALVLAVTLATALERR